MGLEAVEFVLDIEREFGIELPDELASQVATVGEMVDLVHETLRSADRRIDRSMVLDRIRRFAAEQSGLPPERILEGNRFREDLNWG